MSAPGVYLFRANLTHADLRYADLSHANIADADLTGANLTNAKLTGANLTNAKLINALVSGVDFSGERTLAAWNGRRTFLPLPQRDGSITLALTDSSVPTPPVSTLVISSACSPRAEPRACVRKHGRRKGGGAPIDGKFIYWPYLAVNTRCEPMPDPLPD